MRVLLTGGTGKVGAAAVRRLVAGGWGVRVIGRRQGMELPGAEYVACDVTCFDELREAMRGCEAVVHLAAIPSPSGAPGPEVTRVNVLGTFNVFEAAAAEGIRRIVQASSINAFGCFFSTVDLPQMRYFPVDEEHPTFTTDPYSFSKEVVERIGEYYWRRDAISNVALRLPWVHPADYTTGEHCRERVEGGRALIDELVALPEPARLARLAEVREKVAAYRRERSMENRGKGHRRGKRPTHDDPLIGMYHGSRFNFWAFLDERDSAQAIEKSLTADYEGSHVLFVNDCHNWLLYDTEKLLELFFPTVTERRRPIAGCESLISIDAARGLIGFEPEHCFARIWDGPAD